MSQNPGHIVRVEHLRAIPGHKHVHPAVTAVVERSGAHVKVCVTSRPVRGYEGQDLFRWPSERTVAVAMESRAKSIAGTYGAVYLPAGA